VASIFYLGRTYPSWLFWWLWISYILLFIGELQAWWVQYFLAPDAVRAARYQVMFGNTHAFLPARNGIRPNTLHVILHAATLAILIVLALFTLEG
jgi:dihydrodipicolinate synthase/N-acetylneuraminate lyase